MIVENSVQLEEFKRTYDTEDCILIPIQLDDNKHSVSDKLSLLYVQMWGGKEFMLPFNHSETINIDVKNLYKMSSKHKLYTYDRKRLNHFVNINNVIDVNLLHYMSTGHPLDLEQLDTTAHNFLNMRYYKKENINTIVPVLKHLEKCRKISKILKDTVEKYKRLKFESYDDYKSNRISLEDYDDFKLRYEGLISDNENRLNEIRLNREKYNEENKEEVFDYLSLMKDDLEKDKKITSFKDKKRIIDKYVSKVKVKRLGEDEYLLNFDYVIINLRVYF